MLSVLLLAAPPSVKAPAKRAPPALIEISTLIPDAAVELKYATDDNFMKHAVYPSTAKCLVLAPLGEKLVTAAAALRAQGFRLKFYDCYRPHPVQYDLWKAYPVKGYVAVPASGSNHNRGGAIDVTLISLEGNPVEMPTPFDTFSRAAHHSYQGGSKASLLNRKQLRDALEAVGLKRNPMEWWHYELEEVLQFPLRDDPFN